MITEEKRLKNRLDARKWRESKKLLGLCAQCGKTPMPNGGQCAKCNSRKKIHRRENLETYHQRQRASRKRRRQVVIDYYGGKCACCGITELAFLAIDHIDGGGNKHRKEVGRPMTDWLYNKRPEGFQVLCHNCNFAKHFAGRCPHVDNPS